MFSGLLLALSLVHSALQLAGKCLPLASSKGVCESSSMFSGISACFMVLWQFLYIHYRHIDGELLNGRQEARTGSS